MRQAKARCPGRSRAVASVIINSNSNQRLAIATEPLRHDKHLPFPSAPSMKRWPSACASASSAAIWRRAAGWTSWASPGRWAIGRTPMRKAPKVLAAEGLAAMKLRHGGPGRLGLRPQHLSVYAQYRVPPPAPVCARTFAPASAPRAETPAERFARPFTTLLIASFCAWTRARRPYGTKTHRCGP